MFGVETGFLVPLVLNPLKYYFSHYTEGTNFVWDKDEKVRTLNIIESFDFNATPLQEKSRIIVDRSALLVQKIGLNDNLAEAERFFNTGGKKNNVYFLLYRGAITIRVDARTKGACEVLANLVTRFIIWTRPLLCNGQGFKEFGLPLSVSDVIVTEEEAAGIPLFQILINVPIIKEELWELNNDGIILKNINTILFSNNYHFTNLPRVSIDGVGDIVTSNLSSVMRDPYIGNVVFLWHANNSLNCTIGGPLLQDGTGTFVAANAFNVYSYSNNGSAPSGGGSNVLYWLNSNSIDLNSSDFTIELRVFISSRQSGPRYLMNVTDSTGATEYAIVLDTDGTHQGVLGMFKVSSTTYAYVGITTQNTLPLNQWNHIAFTRHGNDYYLFVNGILSIGGTYSSNYRNGTGVKDLYITNSARFFIDALAGLVDELEITRGIARYISDFDVSSIPVPLLDI